MSDLTEVESAKPRRNQAKYTPKSSLVKEGSHKFPTKEERMRAARSLYEDGFSVRSIEKMTGVPKSTVARWIKADRK